MTDVTGTVPNANIVEVDMDGVDAELAAIIQKESDDSLQFMQRVRRSKRVMFWAKVTMVIASLLALLGMVILYFYMFWPKYITDFDKYGSHTATCVFKVGDRTVNGTRTYGYRYMTVLGYRVYMTPADAIEEETRIDIVGNGMTIILQDGGEPIKKEFISDGERFRKLLNRADSYIFFMDGGKNTARVEYKDLCK